MCIRDSLITIEDILEELVGEIEDEHDVEEEDIVEISKNKFYVDAKVELDEFINFFQLEIDPLAVDAETLGGFFIAEFGMLPKNGEKLKVQDLTIKVSTDINDIKLVANLLEITAKRHKFTPFSLKYLEAEFSTFQECKAGRIYLCYYQDELIAASITYQNGKTKVYKHGASNMKYKNIPASYLIQWQSILDALKDGLHTYNFWGVAPSKDHKKHPFYGITHFKLGFGAKQLDLLPAMDMMVNFRYIFNWLIETLRRLKRGF